MKIREKVTDSLRFDHAREEFMACGEFNIM